MGIRLYPRTLGRIKIAYHYLDDVDHRLWVRQFFSLGFVVLDVRDSYVGNHIEYVIDHDKLPPVAEGAVIPFYDVVVHKREGKVVQFEFVERPDEKYMYGGDHFRFMVDAPLADPSRTAQEGVEEVLHSGTASDSAPDGQEGVGLFNTEVVK